MKKKKPDSLTTDDSDDTLGPGEVIYDEPRRGADLSKQPDPIDKIRKEQKIKNIAHADYILNIRSNQLTPDNVQKLIAENVVNEKVLMDECNIPFEIIERIKTYRPIYGENIIGQTPIQIPDGFTEVYFWGIPDSGKTCALSTILNTAHKEGYLQTGEGAGLKYLYTLKNLYKTDDDIGYLLEGTPDKTQYLPFTLKKENEKFARSVSLIELSGEVFKCFFKKGIGEELEGNLKDTFETLINYLYNSNRKIHFFFIDYASTSILQDDYTQSDYFEEACKYFKKHKIFSKSTDAIYVVVTKSDLVEGFGTDDDLLKANINKYIDDKYSALDKYLRSLCKQEGINAGKYDIIPFSIGNVYCKRICKINREPAKIVINRLFDRIQPQKRSLLDFLDK